MDTTKTRITVTKLTRDSLKVISERTFRSPSDMLEHIVTKLLITGQYLLVDDSSYRDKASTKIQIDRSER